MSYVGRYVDRNEKQVTRKERCKKRQSQEKDNESEGEKQSETELLGDDEAHVAGGKMCGNPIVEGTEFAEGGDEVIVVLHHYHGAVILRAVTPVGHDD